MQATLAELAALVDGRLIGDGSVTILGAAPLLDAGPGQITLIDKAERANGLKSRRVSAAVAPRSVTLEGIPVLQVDDVHQAFAVIVARFRPPRSAERVGLSPHAVISPTARLGKDVDVHPMATIGDEVEIGDGSTIHAGVSIMAGSKIGPGVTVFPRAVLYENTVVGPRCVIHAGAVLGAYGFGYSCEAGRHHLSPQLGNVVLEADVEVGAGATIDRGTYGPTVVGEGTKIDNLVMVAHNCRIGRHNMLCAQAGIAGSSTTGDYAVLAGQAGVRDHVHIGARAMLGAKAGVMNDVPDDGRVVGVPAFPERDWLVQTAAVTKLPEMRRQLRRLQRMVEKMADPGADAPSADAA
jgi:UDP-3-O-[3-hydroxymyristoyl] glucosamine N-acyltransferase